MRIRCMITRSFLTRYLYGELGERLGRYLHEHLEECDRCRALARDEEAVQRQVVSFTPPEVTEDEWDELWEGVMGRAGSDEKSVSARRMVPFPRQHSRARYAVIAAAVALLVVGAVARLMFTENQSQQAPISSLIQYHENAVDTHVLLEDHFWSAQVLPVSYATSK